MTTYTGEFSIAAWDEETYAEPGSRPEAHVGHGRAAADRRRHRHRRGPLAHVLRPRRHRTVRGPPAHHRLDRRPRGHGRARERWPLRRPGGHGAWTIVPGSGTDGLAGDHRHRRVPGPDGRDTLVHPRLPLRVSTTGGTNLLGALVVALGDRVDASITRSSGLARNDAIALSALHHFLEAPRIDRIADVLGLTSSGTVRLVDRLEAAGLVRRSAGDDSRATTVALTAPAGARRRRSPTPGPRRSTAPSTPSPPPSVARSPRWPARWWPASSHPSASTRGSAVCATPKAAAAPKATAPSPPPPGHCSPRRRRRAQNPL